MSVTPESPLIGPGKGFFFFFLYTRTNASSSNTIVASSSNVPAFKRLRTSSFDDDDVSPVTTILDIIFDMSKLLQELHVGFFEHTDLFKKQHALISKHSVSQMDESPSVPVRPKTPTVAETTYLVGMAGIGRGRSPSNTDVTSPSSTARGRGIHRCANPVYCGEPLPNDDFGHPLSFPVVDWKDTLSLPIHKPPLVNPTFDDHPGMVPLPSSFQAKEVILPDSALDTFHRAQKKWDTCRAMLAHCAHLTETNVNNTNPAWIYGIHPVPGYLPHNSALWNPLVDLLVSQSKDIHSCVIDILNTQARRSHDQFVGELRSLEHQVGRDPELASGTRMKLAQYCNTAQRRKLIEHHKHILDGPALDDVKKELRRRMITNTYKGPLQPPPTQNQPLQNRPNPQPQAQQQAQATAASGASSDRGRVRSSAKARIGKRPAVSGDRRDNSRDTRPTNSQGPPGLPVDYNQGISHDSSHA